MVTSPKLSIIKTLTWRIIASTTTVLIAWFFTGDLQIGLAVGGTEAVAKIILYYLHERAWDRFIPLFMVKKESAEFK